ncbi:MAG: GPP34 family phosphoprotein [Rhodobacteraceae bacterium]|nr:GPP34 family phosphoprotein [Paracoccaceae bacterium]
MLSFTEDILLLLLVEEGGTAAQVQRPALACAFAGAVLMDLAFANRIDTDPATVFVVDRTPIGNPVLDRVLAMIERTEEAMDARAWIGALSEREAQIARELTTLSLVRRGIVSLPDDSFNWARVASRLNPVVDHAARRDVRMRVRGALFSDDIPAPRDAALIGLVDACGIFGGIFPDQDIEEFRPRVEMLRGMELITREIPGAISDIENGVRHLAATP